MHRHPAPEPDGPPCAVPGPSRRTLLQGAVVAGAGLALTACGGGESVSRPVPASLQLSPLFPVKSPHVVAGAPARFLKWRHPRDIAERLQALAWWDWSHEEIRSALPDFRALSAEAFLEKYEQAPVMQPLHSVG